jgi:3-methyladenine DNA glycosylase Tag
MWGKLTVTAESFHQLNLVIGRGGKRHHIIAAKKRRVQENSSAFDVTKIVWSDLK